MSEWKATILILVLVVIMGALITMNFEIAHVIHAIDMGKFMPFVYTGK